MGACQNACADRGAEVDSYNVGMVSNRWMSGAITPEEVKAKTIEIGENGFSNPLMRRQMLNEDFSHIFDKQFEDKNREAVVLLQSNVRLHLVRKSYNDLVGRQRMQDELEPPKYFTNAENAETLQ